MILVKFQVPILRCRLFLSGVTSRVVTARISYCATILPPEYLFMFEIADTKDVLAIFDASVSPRLLCTRMLLSVWAVVQ